MRRKSILKFETPNLGDPPYAKNMSALLGLKSDDLSTGFGGYFFEKNFQSEFSAPDSGMTTHRSQPAIPCGIPNGITVEGIKYLYTLIPKLWFPPPSCFLIPYRIGFQTSLQQVWPYVPLIGGATAPNEPFDFMNQGLMKKTIFFR